MKLNRTKNAKRNIVFGMLNRIYTMVIPFVVRSVFIWVLGIEYLGLDSLFVSIINVLSLTELGVGNALVYHMYGAIARDDKQSICALMSFYKKCYRIIGWIIVGLGLLLLPFLKYLIRADLPNDVNLYILYLIQLFSTAVTYWLFAYRNCLFNAYQRNDVIYNINTAVVTIKFILQIALLIFTQNYYYYIIVVALTNILQNIFTAYLSKRYFPDYEPDGEINSVLKKDIFKRMKALLYSKIGAMVVNSADVLVISAFLGLKLAGVYSNYHYIITSVIGFISIVSNSMTAGIGNSLVIESKEKNYADFKKMSLLNDWIIMWCTVCFLCLFQPFIRFWLMDTDYLLDMSTVALLCAFFYFWKSNNIMLLYKDAGGLWYEDRFRPLLVGIANLILDIILVNYMGINGVVLASALVYLIIAIPWLFTNVHHYIFDNSPKEMVLRLVKNTFVTLLACVITGFVCSKITCPSEGRVNIGICIAIRFIICTVLPNLVFVAVNGRMPEFRQMIQKMCFNR